VDAQKGVLCLTVDTSPPKESGSLFLKSVTNALRRENRDIDHSTLLNDSSVTRPRLAPTQGEPTRRAVAAESPPAGSSTSSQPKGSLLSRERPWSSSCF